MSEKGYSRQIYRQLWKIHTYLLLKKGRKLEEKRNSLLKNQTQPLKCLEFLCSRVSNETEDLFGCAEMGGLDKHEAGLVEPLLYGFSVSFERW